MMVARIAANVLLLQRPSLTTTVQGEVCEEAPGFTSLVMGVAGPAIATLRILESRRFSALRTADGARIPFRSPAWILAANEAWAPLRPEI